MGDHLYPGMIQALGQAICGTNSRQLVESVAPNADPPADGMIRWELIPRSAQLVDVQAGVQRIQYSWDAFAKAALGAWETSQVAGLLEDVDAVWQSIDSMPGQTYSDGGVLCEAVVEGHSIDWDELVANVTLTFNVIIERYSNV